MSLNIIPKPAIARDLYKSSDYSQDLKNDGAKVPIDEHGKMQGGLNFPCKDRETQLVMMQSHLNLSNTKDAKPLQHLVFSYSEGIRPSRLKVESHIKKYLDILGIPGAMALYDCHENTKNFHVHVLIDRLSKFPDKKGKYKISDNGEFKEATKSTRPNGKKRIQIRTDESVCRQVTIARICRKERWKPPELTHDHDGKPIPRTKQKDVHSQKTIAGERKSGKKSKERQLAEVSKKLFEQAVAEHSTTKGRFWTVVDRLFAEKNLELHIKYFEDGKPGGVVLGPGNRKCSFSKIGKEYSARSLISQYGAPTLNDTVHPTEYDLQPFAYQNLYTKEEIKKQLLPILSSSKTWKSLIANTLPLGEIQRSGGGLLFRYNNNRDSIKFSEISNKYSLSRLEKILGPCPINKPKPTTPTLPSETTDSLTLEVIKNVTFLALENVLEANKKWHYWEKWMHKLRKSNARLERFGNDIFIVHNEERARLLSLSSQFTLSYLQDRLGKCPLPHAVYSSPREDLIRESSFIIKWVTGLGYGTRNVQYELSKINARLEVIPHQGSYIVRGKTQVPLNILGVTLDDLNRLDREKWHQHDEVAEWFTQLISLPRERQQDALPIYKEEAANKLPKIQFVADIHPELKCPEEMYKAIKHFFCLGIELFPAWLSLQGIRRIKDGLSEGLVRDDTMKPPLPDIPSSKMMVVERLVKAVKLVDTIINPDIPSGNYQMTISQEMDMARTLERFDSFNFDTMPVKPMGGKLTL